MKEIHLIIKILFLNILLVGVAVAQQNQINSSQQFRLASRIIRIAEPGQLADSVNIWGDVETTGMFLVPKGTKMVDLLSYSGGMSTIRSGLTQIDWSKMRVEINIHRIDDSGMPDLVNSFKFRFEDTFPPGMWNFVLENDHTVTVRVKRKPSFRDYLAVFASTVSAVASTVILLDRLNNK